MSRTVGYSYGCIEGVRRSPYSSTAIDREMHAYYKKRRLVRFQSHSIPRLSEPQRGLQTHHHNEL